MRSVTVAAGVIAAALLASCAESAREIPLADAQAAVTRIARSTPPAALCKPSGREAMRQAVRDYTAALDRADADFVPSTRFGRPVERMVVYGLLVGDLKVNDFRGEARGTAERILTVAREFDGYRALRALHRNSCEETVAYVQREARQSMSRTASRRRIERAMERGDYQRAAQLREHASRRGRIAASSSPGLEREIELMLRL